MFHYVINSTWPLLFLYVTYRTGANIKRKFWVPIIWVYEEISKEFFHNLFKKRDECDLSNCWNQVDAVLSTYINICIAWSHKYGTNTVCKHAKKPWGFFSKIFNLLTILVMEIKMFLEKPSLLLFFTVLKKVTLKTLENVNEPILRKRKNKKR